MSLLTSSKNSVLINFKLRDNEIFPEKNRWLGPRHATIRKPSETSEEDAAERAARKHCRHDA